MTKKSSRARLKVGMVADPIVSFNPQAETSFFILHESCERGHTNYIWELDGLFLEDGRILAKARQVEVTREYRQFYYHLGEEELIDLTTLDCIFLRKDPPVDAHFLDHLALLSIFEKGAGKKTLMVNSPSGVAAAPEKIYPHHFPGISPPTLVSHNRKAMLDFVKLHGKAVLKPLHLSGGRGIAIVNSASSHLSQFLETASDGFKTYMVLQAYLEEAKTGDKRILLLNGKSMGCFLRVPHPDDFRGNMHQGAKWVKSRLTAREEQMIRKIKPKLLADGLYFVGLDVIGDRITEINSTSPMGIREINELEKKTIEKDLWNWVERSVRSSSK